MAGQKEVKTTVKLFGKVDSTFNELSKKMRDFGSSVSGVGGMLTAITAPAFAAGKAATDLFTDYDDVMRRIQAVGNYTTEEMEVISSAARQAGADTRYMALDAGEAILYLTQAGVGMDDSLDVLPTLLNAAAAGSMELATASDLLISNVYSLGKEFKRTDVSTYVDAVTTAADATNTNLEEIMEGVSKVGAAGRMFGGGDNELLAFLGMLSNLNLKGSTGGVNARNMIISLLAPTQKASMMMENLSITEEEMGEALEGVNLEESAQMIEQLGLQTTDAEGKVRPMIDIMTDLKSAISGMDDDEVANTLYTMFGKRTYPAVAGLLDLLDEYPELLSKIEASSGSAERKAEILEGGIGGSTRRLKSAVQELGLSFGDAADEKVVEWMDEIRELVLDLSEFIGELDPEVVSQLMDNFARLAILGPSLMIAGKAISGIGTALHLMASPTGKVLALVGALGALYAAFDAYEDIQDANYLSDHFGTLEFDTEKTKEIISSLSSEFEEKSKSLATYKEAIEAASSAYETAVAGLSGGLLEAYFAQTELTEGDKEDLITLAGNMSDSLKEALQQQKLYLSDIIDIAYDGSEIGDGEKNAGWDELGNQLFGDLEEQAQEAGANLRAKLVEALQDGNLSEDELEAIQASQERMNTIMAEINRFTGEYDAKLAYNKALYMSYDSIEEQLSAVDEAQKLAEEAVTENYAALLTTLEMAQEQKTALPEKLQDQYGAGEYDYEKVRSGLLADMETDRTDARLERDKYAARIASEKFRPFKGEELAPFYQWLDMAASGNQNEMDEAYAALSNVYNGDYNRGDYTRFGELVFGDTFSHVPIDQIREDMERQIEKEGSVSEELFGLYRDYIASALYSGNYWGDVSSPLQNGGQFVGPGGQDLGTMEEYQRYASFVGASPTIEVQAELATTPEELAEEIEEAAQQTTVTVPVEAETTVTTVASATQAESAPLAQEVETEIVASPSPTDSASTYVTAVQGTLDSAGLSVNISLPNGYTDGLDYAMGYQSALDANPAVMRVKTLSSIGGSSGGSGGGGKKFAEGGRADEPSIFGEDGPEWAIPEEHTARTAHLLQKAAQASGFAPSDAGMNGTPVATAIAPQFVYSPTIYAQDAEGVREALDIDREQLEDWYEEKMRTLERRSYA